VCESVGDKKPLVPCLVTCKILAASYKLSNLSMKKKENIAFLVKRSALKRFNDLY
jgi:hypothetical protein